MIEILVSIVFISFAFLPIYNLFRFGQQGTYSNEREIEATNYASDLVNFLRDRQITEMDQVFGSVTGEILLNNDGEIEAAFAKANLKTPPAVSQGYNRKLMVRRFDGKNQSGFLGIGGWLSDWKIKKRKVENFLVKVEVTYDRADIKNAERVTLFSIVME
jgi:hypothetical protein